MIQETKKKKGGCKRNLDGKLILDILYIFVFHENYILIVLSSGHTGERMCTDYYSTWRLAIGGLSRCALRSICIKPLSKYHSRVCKPYNFLRIMHFNNVLLIMVPYSAFIQ